MNPHPTSNLLVKPPAGSAALKTQINRDMNRIELQDKEFFEKYLAGLVGEVFGEELMDKTKPDFYMVNFLRDDVLDEEGSLVEEAPKVIDMVE